MKIQVLIQTLSAFEKAEFITSDNYKYSCDDVVKPTYGRVLAMGYIDFREDNCPEQVAADIAKDLAKAGLKKGKDFQIVIWQ